MEWLVGLGPWAAAIVALALGLGLKDWLWRPKLALAHREDDRDRILMTLTGGTPGAYVRVRVENLGRAAARQVQVRILSLERYVDGRWELERHELDARALAWANAPAKVSAADIPRRTHRPLDLVIVERIDRPGTGWVGRARLAISEEAGVPTSSGDLFNEAGSWRVSVVVSGENFDPILQYFLIGFSAQWWNTPETFWENTIRVSGPTAEPPGDPLIVATVEKLLEEAARTDDFGAARATSATDD